LAAGGAEGAELRGGAVGAVATTNWEHYNELGKQRIKKRTTN
jgi:hypothetical protein